MLATNVRREITGSTHRRAPAVDGGIVKPRAFAAFMLMTSSKVAGCSIGSSLGFVPLTVLSTWVAAGGQDAAIEPSVIDRADFSENAGRCARQRQVGFVPWSIVCTVCSRPRTRRDRIVSIRLIRSGVSSSSRQKWGRSTTNSRRSVVATIVADRGSPSSRLISPKNSPGCNSAPVPTGVRTATVPSMMTKNDSPGSPI